MKEELCLPGAVIDRANRTRWQEEGALTLLERARHEVDQLLNRYEPSRLSEDTKKDLKKTMLGEAQRCGMDVLPDIVI
jgi:trimethylamine:corrinoid methyltransferase-like protein